MLFVPTLYDFFFFLYIIADISSASYSGQVPNIVDDENKISDLISNNSLYKLVHSSELLIYNYLAS